MPESSDHIRRFEKALNSEHPERELPQLAITLRDEGVSQIALYMLFQRFQIATSGDDPKYDAIVDTMDMIYGGPWAKGNDLYPTELTEDQIDDGRKNRRSV